jgi:hypothetical protein
MKRTTSILLLVSLVMGCGPDEARFAQPESAQTEETQSAGVASSGSTGPGQIALQVPGLQACRPPLLPSASPFTAPSASNGTKGTSPAGHEWDVYNCRLNCGTGWSNCTYSLRDSYGNDLTALAFVADGMAGILRWNPTATTPSATIFAPLGGSGTQWATEFDRPTTCDDLTDDPNGDPAEFNNYLKPLRSASSVHHRRSRSLA